MKGALVGKVTLDVHGRHLAFAHALHGRSYGSTPTPMPRWRRPLWKMTSLILPTVNTAMMQLFLEHVSHTFADYFIVMQVDNASWHGAKALVVPDNIRLIPQPAYSPELNPVEHIWEEIREKQLPNLALPALEGVIEKVCDGLRQLEAAPERLRSMTYFPHFRPAA